jgi:N-acetylglucosaminyldiphosphoundecaprenol N-acetyl-beta-D-mannosaminyltransferase
MRSVADEVGVPLVGVGSAFDLLAGRTRPAPEWMKRHGLQWLFRLAQEPRRLGWRYLHYNSRFIAAVLRRRGPRTDRGPVAP